MRNLTNLQYLGLMGLLAMGGYLLTYDLATMLTHMQALDLWLGSVDCGYQSLSFNPVHSVMIALALWQWVDVIRHSEQPQVAWFRARCEESEYEWIRNLINCGWCISIGSGFLLTFLWALAESSGWAAFRLIGHVLILSLAVSKLANMFNDMTYSFNRMPRDYVKEETGDTSAAGEDEVSQNPEADRRSDH